MRSILTLIRCIWEDSFWTNFNPKNWSHVLEQSRFKFYIRNIKNLGSYENRFGNQSEPDINIAIYDFVDVEFVPRILDRPRRSRTLVKPCISMIKFYRRLFFPFIDSSLLKLVMKRENSRRLSALFPRTLSGNKNSTNETNNPIRTSSLC